MNKSEIVNLDIVTNILNELKLQEEKKPELDKKRINFLDSLIKTGKRLKNGRGKYRYKK